MLLQRNMAELKSLMDIFMQPGLEVILFLHPTVVTLVTSTNLFIPSFSLSHSYGIFS